MQPPANFRPTSQIAAEQIKPCAGTLRARVLSFIESTGQAGATDIEIQDALSMEGNTERPRRGELLKIGLIRDSGRTRKTRSGRAAVVWEVTQLASNTEDCRRNDDDV